MTGVYDPNFNFENLLQTMGDIEWGPATMSRLNDDIILRGFKAYDAGVGKDKNPFDPKLDPNNFAFWYYGWLQAYYTDKEKEITRT